MVNDTIVIDCLLSSVDRAKMVNDATVIDC